MKTEFKKQAILNAQRSYINNVFKSRHNFATKNIDDAIDKIRVAVQIVRFYES